jgi:hypothetical protein
MSVEQATSSFHPLAGGDGGLRPVTLPPASVPDRGRDSSRAPVEVLLELSRGRREVFGATLPSRLYVVRTSLWPMNSAICFQSIPAAIM